MPQGNNQKRTAVLKDIARLAGVDTSTVSRVLSGDQRKPAKPATRDKILKIARELDYRTNSTARSLRTKRQDAIGLVIPDATNPGFAQIFKGVQAITSKMGRHVIVVEGGKSSDSELGWEGLILEGRVDGVLVLVASIHDKIVERIGKSGFPIVLVNRRSNEINCSVVVDDAKGSEVAVDHFVELGHQNIGHISGPQSLDTGRRRTDGFKAALKKHKLRLNPKWIVETDYSEEGGRRAALDLLEQSSGKLPTAIYVASFMSGLGAMQVFKQHGLRIPEDISVIVSDELPLAAHTAPPLTTIDMSLTQMGEVAAEKLMDIIAGQANVEVMLGEKPKLVIRESTAKPLR